MSRRPAVPPLVADSLAALEARDYERAQIVIEQAVEDRPDDSELACVLSAIDMKIECLRVLKVHAANSSTQE